jgi:hypothetical protein
MVASPGVSHRCGVNQTLLFMMARDALPYLSNGQLRWTRAYAARQTRDFLFQAKAWLGTLRTFRTQLLNQILSCLTYQGLPGWV